MSWLNPPAEIRRFTLHAIAQHWMAVLIGTVSTLALAASIVLGHPWWKTLHVYAGIAGAFFLLYHFAALIVIGIRHDMPLEKVAFLPVGKEWRALRSGTGAFDGACKYTPEEKGDYLNILFWSTLLALSGIALRWPGRLGVPGPHSFAFLKAVHAGIGAAWTIQILVRHVPGRWLRASADLRRAILTGKTTLAEAERRPGWIADLVSGGVLVAVPEEKRTEEQKESRHVRDLLEEGNRLAGEGHFEEACAAFEEALVLLPDYSQARFNLGVARMKQGKKEAAAEQFRQFVEMDPFNPMAAKARQMIRTLDEGEGGDA